MIDFEKVKNPKKKESIELNRNIKIDFLEKSNVRNN